MKLKVSRQRMQWLHWRYDDPWPRRWWQRLGLMLATLLGANVMAERRNATDLLETVERLEEILGQALPMLEAKAEFGYMDRAWIDLINREMDEWDRADPPAHTGAERYILGGERIRIPTPPEIKLHPLQKEIRERAEKLRMRALPPVQSGEQPMRLGPDGGEQSEDTDTGRSSGL